MEGSFEPTLEHAISKLESENVRLTSQRMAIRIFRESSYTSQLKKLPRNQESFPDQRGNCIQQFKIIYCLAFLKMSYGDSSSRLIYN